MGKIGFIKEEVKEVKLEEGKADGLRLKKVEVVFVKEEKEVSKLEDVKEKEATVETEKIEIKKEKVVYKNTFNTSVFFELVNHHNVRVSYAILMASDSKFCENFIVNKTKSICKLSNEDIFSRRRALRNAISMTISRAEDIKEYIDRLNYRFGGIDKSVIDNILKGKTIRNNNRNSVNIEIERSEKEIEEMLKAIDSMIRELIELGDDMAKVRYKDDIEVLKI